MKKQQKTKKSTRKLWPLTTKTEEADEEEERLQEAEDGQQEKHSAKKHGARHAQ